MGEPAPGGDELPPVEILDVTLRDGGYLNGHCWTTRRVVAVLTALGQAGIRWAEVGYVRAGASPGRWFECEPEALDRVAAALGERPRLVGMVKPDECTPDGIAALAGHSLAMVRFPVHPGRLEAVAEHCAAAKEAGLQVSLNLTRVSQVDTGDVVAAVKRAADLGADIVYLADSNGSMLPVAVDRLFRAVAGPVPLGFHAHDNLHLAFANSLAARAAGAAFLDASVAGIGKGGGNLMLELVCAYLAFHEGAPFDLPPLDVARRAVARERRSLAGNDLEAIASGVQDLNLEQLTSVAAAGGTALSLLTAASGPQAGRRGTP